jgi:hypothetical protein
MWRVDWKNTNVNLHYNPITLEFENIDELIRYKEECLYNYRLATDISSLDFPNKFVAYNEYIGCDCLPENEQDTDCSYCGDAEVHVTKIVTLDEYKRMLTKHLETL